MRLIFFFLVLGVLGGSLAQAQTSLCVHRSGALLRSSPQASAPLSWKVPKYMPLKSTGFSKNGFYEVVDLDGQKHWASSNDVSSRLKCLVVSARTARLRTGPGSEFAVARAGVADRYSTFIDHGGEDGWTQVEDQDGEKSWINLDQVWKPSRRLRMSFDN
jgi:uncharacterized protein YgiM (DUF1202 family)